MVGRFDAASDRNAEPGIVRASRAPLGSSPERLAVDFMAGCPRDRGRLKVKRELLRLSDKDGQKWPAGPSRVGNPWQRMDLLKADAWPCWCAARGMAISSATGLAPINGATFFNTVAPGSGGSECAYRR
jgi:hypothetical protein